MVLITREQVDYLIEKGYLKNVRGHYPDLTITCRDKNSCRKKHYISDDVAKYLPKVENKK